jgi:uncharacterized protein (TIGR03435 family)
MIHRIRIVVAVTTLSATLAAGQSFEVASIKMNTSGGNWGPYASSVAFDASGRFTMIDGAAMVLIRSAFPDSTEVVGAPDWVSAEHYDVQAKAAGDATREQRTLMLRSLLADRFKLVAHEEPREQATYALMVERSDGSLGPKLRHYSGDCAAPSEGAPVCGATISSSRIVASGWPMAALARNLRGKAGRVVIDRTGLVGDYEFILEWADDVTIFTALREQLGLKLEPSRDPLPILVVDRIERPTPD